MTLGMWASLRAALSGYPVLLAQVPGRAGPVDSLPWSTATVHVRESAKPGPVSGSIVTTEAEAQLAKIVADVARNRGYTWPAVRAALSRYPALLAQVLHISKVDGLPLGLPAVAVQRDRRVLWQGAFVGSQEKKA